MSDTTKKTMTDLCGGTGRIDNRRCPGCDECIFYGPTGLRLQVGGECPDCNGSGDMHDGNCRVKERCWACDGTGEIGERAGVIDTEQQNIKADEMNATKEQVERVANALQNISKFMAHDEECAYTKCPDHCGCDCGMVKAFDEAQSAILALSKHLESQEPKA